MWFSKKAQLDSAEYKKLNEKITKLEGDVNMLDVKILNMQESAKLLRAKLRKKLEDTDADEPKDIYNGVLLPDK
jgi:hypothetical protein